ncbi:hypothetical protein Tco_0487540 [Tanacetum coccineum]
MEKSESYLATPKHRECYDGLKKSYALDQDSFYSYDVYTLKRGQKDKDKDEDPSTRSDRGSSGKYVQSEEPVFEVADSDMPQDQEGDMGDNEDEPRKETSSRSDWFKKPTPVQEPTDPDWHVGKTTQEGPPQKWLMTLAASTPTDKSLKDFDELMSTPIDFSSFIMNGLNISNLKVFTNMFRKGLKFLGKITPLFPNMLTHAAEGEGSGELTEPQPTPSPTQPST